MPSRRPLGGLLWMLLAAVTLAGGNTLVRWVAAELPPVQILFLGSTLGALAFAPWMVRAGPAIARTPRPGLMAALLACGAATTLSWFYGLALAPLAEATAISFSAPLLVTALASVVLGERVRLDRWLATLVGFAGMLVIVRPGLMPVGLGTALVLAATLGMAAVYLLTKLLSGVSSASQLMALTNLSQAVLTAPVALAGWVTPSAGMVPWVLAQSVLMVAGRLFFIRALAAADASVVMPVDFARLPFIALMAFLAFGQVPDGWTWVGSGLIIGAVAFTARRQRPDRRAAC